HRSRSAAPSLHYPPCRVSGADGDDFASVIVAAGRAQIVGALQLATVRAFLESLDGQLVMAAAHAALGRRCFSLRDSHAGTCSKSSKKFKTCRLPQATGPAAYGHKGSQPERSGVCERLRL